MVDLNVARESWPIRGSFTISRGSRTTAEVVVVQLSDGSAHRPRRMRALSPLRRDGRRRDPGDRGPARRARPGPRPARPAGPPAGRGGAQRPRLRVLGPGGQGCWQAGLGAGRPAAPGPVASAYTLSLDTPARMAVSAKDNADRPLLKLKLSGPDDLDRVAAVRANAPRSPADRRRQRRLDGRPVPQLAEAAARPRRRHDRAAAARRRRRGPGRDRPAGAGVRGRVLPRPRQPGRRSPASTTWSTSSSTRPAG